MRTVERMLPPWREPVESPDELVNSDPNVAMGRWCLQGDWTNSVWLFQLWAEAQTGGFFFLPLGVWELSSYSLGAP